MLVRFYAVGREVSGLDEWRSDASSLASLTEELGNRFGSRMERLVASSTLLIDGRRHRSTDDLELSESDVVDLLPPFAGG